MNNSIAVVMQVRLMYEAAGPIVGLYQPKAAQLVGSTVAQAWGEAATDMEGSGGVSGGDITKERGDTVDCDTNEERGCAMEGGEKVGEVGGNVSKARGGGVGGDMSKGRGTAGEVSLAVAPADEGG